MRVKPSVKKSVHKVTVGLLLTFFLSAHASDVSFKLFGPEVIKSDWNIRSLIAHDFNGDGFNDLAIINNDRARIELFYHKNKEQNTKQRLVRQDRWDPVLEDARFTKKNIVCGQHLYSLAATDFNRDGYADLVYTGNQDPLTIRFQGNGGDWNKTFVYKDMIPSQWNNTLKLADLDNDGHEEIILLADKIFVFRYTSSNSELLQPETYRLTEAKAYGLQVIDVNEDGLPDLFYLIHNADHALRIRIQNKNGGFGPEFSFKINPASSIVHPYALEKEPAYAFAFIQAKTHLLQLFQFVQPTESPSRLKDLQAQVYPISSEESRTVSYSTGDFNGDGLDDIAIGDINESQVLMYFQNAAGIFEEPQSFPSLAKISGLAAIQFQKTSNASLILLSEEEGLLGIAQMSESGRLSFPERIDITGNPVAIATADVNNNGDDDLIIIEKIERNYQLTVIEVSNTQEKAKTSIKTTLPIDSLKRKPEAIHIVDLNNDQWLDIVIITPRESAGLLLQIESGVFKEVAATSPVRKSQLKAITPAQLNSADINGDGREELIIARKGFCRSLQLNTNNECEIVDQYNSRRGADEIGGPLLIDLDKDGEKELIFYNFTAKTLELLKRDESGVYRYTESVDIGAIDLVSAKTFLLGAEKESSMLFFGKDRFWSIPLKKKGWQIQTIGSYETDLKDVAYTDLAVGDLNHDEAQDIIAIDGQKHLLEILDIINPKQWKSAMHFTLFDENIHHRGRRGAPLEPRQILITDLGNDGRDDVVLLIHDRLLIYPQK